jgi:hypothetical protein
MSHSTTLKKVPKIEIFGMKIHHLATLMRAAFQRRLGANFA